MRRMMSAVVACVLAAGLAAGLVAAQDVKPVQPAQPPKVVVPIQPLPVRPVAVTAAKMALLEEEFETVEAHRDVKKAYVKAAEVAVSATEKTFEQTKRAHGMGTSSAELNKVTYEYEMAKAQLEIRVAELKEIEVKVKHAKKRLDDAKLGGVRPLPGGVIRPVPVDPLPIGVADNKAEEQGAALQKKLKDIEK